MGAIPRLGDTVSLTIRDYGPQIHSSDFSTTWGLTLPRGVSSPVDIAVAWTVSAGTLPPGLRLDPRTGQLVGTPTAPGTYTFEVTLVGRGRVGGKFSVTLTVLP